MAKYAADDEISKAMAKQTELISNMMVTVKEVSLKSSGRMDEIERLLLKTGSSSRSNTSDLRDRGNPVSSHKRKRSSESHHGKYRYSHDSDDDRDSSNESDSRHKSSSESSENDDSDWEEV